jgi:glycosyltransferase involved in cell wall biosynthesis
MTYQPRVSVVIETITTRAEGAVSTLAEDLSRTLAGLRRQTYNRALIQPIVVLDHAIDAARADDLRRFNPDITFVIAPRADNYFAAKNAGVAASTGEIVAMLDGDCEPAADWLDVMAGVFRDPGVDVVAGCTRYPGDSWMARAFSISSFAGAKARPDGEATAFNLNNVGFRRDVVTSFPFDERVVRHGGCYVHYAHLRVAGKRIVYCPTMRMSHGIGDVKNFGFVEKHFQRGLDGVGIHFQDHGSVLRGTPIVRRFGLLGLIALSTRRTFNDWRAIVGLRREMGFGWIGVPVLSAMAVMLRSIELAGAFTAYLKRRKIAHPGPSA